LVPGGSSIAVTNDNRISYIFFVANYRLNRVIAPACAAFLRGVHELIPAEWLQLFNAREIAMLISGSRAGMDTADLRAHINYAGGYHEDHPVIRSFWEASAFNFRKDMIIVDQ
jgi:ubiquitin-protein ligase E3 C